MRGQRRARLQSGLPYQWPGRKHSLGGAAQLLYADDLVLLAPSRSDLTTALEEVVNYPKTEAVVFGMPTATAAAATIQVGSNSVAVKPSKAGLQIPQGKSVLLQEGGAGRQAQVL